MDYEELEITRLGIGDTLNGIYRGQRVHRFPKFNEQEPEFVASIFLETAGGPVAVKVDEASIEQILQAGIAEGDRIIVRRATEDLHWVAREGAEP
jgi:hypothetical protein